MVGDVFVFSALLGIPDLDGSGRWPARATASGDEPNPLLPDIGRMIRTGFFAVDVLKEQLLFGCHESSGSTGASA